MAAAPTAMALEPFTEEAVARGLVYATQGHPQEDGYLGFGCGFADLDGDGDADVVVLGAADGRVGLFENDGTGHFTDRSAGSGIPPLSEASAFAAGDVDGDGDLDLYLTQVGAPNVLARNDGSFQFTDIAAAAGVADPGSGKAAAFGDYDGDGRLDLFVANYNGIVPGTEEMDDRLYHNLGGGIFEDVSAAQIGDEPDPGYGLGFQAVWFDYDRDRDVDLYLSNDRGHLPPHCRSNRLWRNDDGQLVDVSAGSGADLALFSMGVACGDFDGDAWPDLYATNVAGAGPGSAQPGPGCPNEFPGEGPNPLLLNQGDGTFTEESAAWAVDHFITSWGSIFFDFDNDAHQDLYVNNMFAPNSLYDCDGGPPCAEIGAAAGVTANRGASFGSAIADLEGDGDLDLLVNNLGGNVELFVNHEGEQRSWLRVRMVDNTENPHAIGGSVEVTAGGTVQIQELMAGGNGYLGQNELVAHFGLGAATTASRVEAVWPDGSVSIRHAVAANQVLVIERQVFTDGFESGDTLAWDVTTD